MAKFKIDLSLIKRLVQELETSVSLAEKLNGESASEKLECTVEYQKSIGFASGIMTESALLLADIQQIIHGNSTPSGSKQDLISQLLGGSKNPGTTN